ncbi:MAG: hypothetical protein ACE37F_08620 [Nannocystaceae bacterium]|nr:hypothetical protein [bacterium]
MRRTLAVAGAVLIPLVGGVFLLGAALDPGKGYQVAPVMTLMVAALFGIPLISVLFRNVRTVWWETRRES